MFKWRNRNKNKKKSPPPVRTGEQVTPERRRQKGGVKKEIADRDATGKVYIERYKANEECALDHYLRTRTLSERQHAAGMRLRRISNHMNNYASSKVTPSPFAAEAGQIDYEERMLTHVECIKILDDAYAALTSAQRRVVRSVCGFDIYAGDSNDKKVLIYGLENLAQYWEEQEKKKKEKVKIK